MGQFSMAKRQRKSSGRMASKGFPNPIDVHVGAGRPDAEGAGLALGMERDDPPGLNRRGARPNRRIGTSEIQQVNLRGAEGQAECFGQCRVNS